MLTPQTKEAYEAGVIDATPQELKNVVKYLILRLIHPASEDYSPDFVSNYKKIRPVSMYMSTLEAALLGDELDEEQKKQLPRR